LNPQIEGEVVVDETLYVKSGYSQSELDKIALRLNQRPRKTLSFQTPASKLRASVAPPP
jgi:IS30 family transposase